MPYTEDGVGYQSGSETSRIAAEMNDGATIRKQVYDLICRSGPISGYAIADQLGYDTKSTQPRISELVGDKLVEPSGLTELSKFGRPVSLWVASHGDLI